MLRRCENRAERRRFARNGVAARARMAHSPGNSGTPNPKARWELPAPPGYRGSSELVGYSWTDLEGTWKGAVRELHRKLEDSWAEALLQGSHRVRDRPLHGGPFKDWGAVAMRLFGTASRQPPVLVGGRAVWFGTDSVALEKPPHGLFELPLVEAGAFLGE